MAADDPDTFYITTPIYYVNDRPHIGHCYTTLLADVSARAQRLLGRDVFFLTGTDEHADKVSTAAAERGLTPIDWATQNAARFHEAFGELGISNDDFIRTTEGRHTDRVPRYLAELVERGDVYQGDYTGWYDPGEEAYVPENEAREHDYKSPVSGKPLVQRTERNYFFRLSAYGERLLEHIESNPGFIRPEARRNEVVGRIRRGLHDTPITRAVDPGQGVWGITMPGDDGHRVYVWIDALFNYYTAVDTDERRRYWPADVHLVGKDILWFHAVIWPCLLMALGRPLPGCVYAHGWWIAEGRKMSKSSGNFIEIDRLRAYASRYSLDGLRWFLATQGPLGANDADFAHARFVEVYNADLANGIGNATSRVSNMIEKYLGGTIERVCDGRFGFEDGVALQTALAAREAAGNPVAEPGRTFNLMRSAARAVRSFESAMASSAVDEALAAGIGLSNEVDEFIAYAAPFTLAKRLDVFEHGPKALATILYASAEALRIASLLLWPAMPDKMARLWRDWRCRHLNDPADAGGGFAAPLGELARWSGAFGLEPGQRIEKGEALFMRADAGEAAPGAVDSGSRAP